jgi:hypothetical protein
VGRWACRSPGSRPRDACPLTAYSAGDTEGCTMRSNGQSSKNYIVTGCCPSCWCPSW